MAENIRATGTVGVIATTTSQVTAMAGTGSVARVANGGLVPVFVEFDGPTAVASPSSSLMVLPGTAELFTLAPTVTHFAAATETGQARVSVSRCAGDQ